MIGQTISHYRITAKLGEGGMGVVYRARDEQLDRDVAIKVLPEAMAQDSERLTRFEHEAKAVAKLAHPNILQIHELGRHEGQSFMVTELLAGQTLRERLEGGGTLGWRQAAEIGSAIADGLAAAHQAGIIHRDLKPSNVFLTADGRVKLLDFGLARTLDVLGSGDSDARTLTKCTAAGSVLGTVGYMSPEQVRGEPADSRSDIFALGCVMYEMVSGNRAFCRATGVETMNAILKEDPAELSHPEADLPPELGSTIRRCLDKGPEARFQSASDLAYNLRSISSASGPGITRERPRVPLSRRPAVWVLLAAAAAVLAAYIWAPWWQGPGSVPEAVPNRVAVASLHNRTGDPSHDNLGVMAAESISRRFAETGAAETVALSLDPGVDPGAAVDDRLIEQALQKEAGLLLSGAYYLEGEAFLLQTRLTESASGELVYTFEAEMVDRSAAAAGIDELSEKLVAAVAFHLHVNNDITVIRPPASYEALQAYRCAEELWGSDYTAAVFHARRALELDPDFHIARLLIPVAYTNIGDYEQAREAVTDAEKYVDRYTPFERSLFRARKAAATGDKVALLIEYRRLVKLAPQLLWTQYNWGDAALETNHPREAIEALTPILSFWVPDHLRYAWWPFSLIADAHHLLGEHELEIRHIDSGLGQFPDVGHLYRCKAAAMAATGRPQAAHDVIDECLRVPLRFYGPGIIMVTAASELRYHDHPEDSGVMARRAVDWFERQAAGSTAKTRSPTVLWFHSGALRLAGRWEEARIPLIEAAESGWRPIDVAGAFGVIAAQLGERDEANRISGQLPLTEDPYAAGVRLYWQACIAAHLGDQDRAVALLREAFNKGLPALIWTDEATGDYHWRLHANQDLEPLWHYPPFEELIKPKG